MGAGVLQSISKPYVPQVAMLLAGLSLAVLPAQTNAQQNSNKGLDGIKVGKYLDIQSRIDRNVPWGAQYYQKAGMLTEIKPELIDLLIDVTKESWPIQTAVNFTQVRRN